MTMESGECGWRACAGYVCASNQVIKRQMNGRAERRVGKQERASEQEIERERNREKGREVEERGEKERKKASKK